MCTDTWHRGAADLKASLRATSAMTMAKHQTPGTTLLLASPCRCEFVKSTGKPSCAALCKCPDYGKMTKISLQTFTTTQGPLIANWNGWW